MAVDYRCQKINLILRRKKMKKLMVTLLIMMSALGANFSAAAASLPTFVSGYVYDASGVGVSGVPINILEDVGLSITGAGQDVTASTGGYGIQVMPGIYTIQAILLDGRVAESTVDTTQGGAWLIFYDSDFSFPLIPSPDTVGEEPGIWDYDVPADQVLTINVNTTNTAGVTPAMEWVFAVATTTGGGQSTFALVTGGWTAAVATPLEALVADFSLPEILTLGSFSM
jgi:hypothetical protein